MAYPDTKITCIKNLWTRQMFFAKAGDANEGHVHNYDHTTLLAYFKAPHMIFIKAGKSHFIEALEDGTVAYCVHALRDKDSEDILDADQVPAGVDAFASGMAKPL
jgi:hypothetical protein